MPIKPLDSTVTATGNENELIPGIGSRRAITQGSKTTKKDKLTMGSAISQLTSGVRRVLGIGEPRKTDRNSLVKFRAVKKLVRIKTIAINGEVDLMDSTISP
jgi:hypothetical protein